MSVRRTIYSPRRGCRNDAVPIYELDRSSTPSCAAPATEACEEFCGSASFGSPWRHRCWKQASQVPCPYGCYGPCNVVTFCFARLPVYDTRPLQNLFQEQSMGILPVKAETKIPCNPTIRVTSEGQVLSSEPQSPTFTTDLKRLACHEGPKSFEAHIVGEPPCEISRK